MANTKKTVANKPATKNVKKENKVEDIKVEDIKITEEDNVVEQLETEEVKALKQQIEEMKKAMETLMKNATTPSINPVVLRQSEDEVVIGCRLLQGVGWGDPSDSSGEVRLRFNEEQTITVSDMKRFFRQHSIKKLFIDGLCYFTEPEDYSLFNIKKYLDLSNDRLINLLSKDDINEIIRELDIMTENKKNSGVINCLVFRICDMIRKRELNWDYYTRKAIEDYFDIQFDRGIGTLNALDSLK